MHALAKTQRVHPDHATTLSIWDRRSGQTRGITFEPANARVLAFLAFAMFARGRQSQVAFATSSVCDRIAFAWAESMKLDCHNALQRKRHERLLVRYSGTFSPVRFEMKVAQLRGFPALLRGVQPRFSATQTVWRRGGDSNPRYRFEWRKSRRVRDLQVFHLFSGVGWLGRVTALWQTSAVPGLIKRRCLAILPLKLVSTAHLKRAKLVRA
jgi:hypothetical protein